MVRLREIYKSEVVPILRKEFDFKNVMEVPRLEKIVVNMGVGEAMSNGKLLDSAMADLALDHRAETAPESCARLRSRRSSCAKACPSGAR